MSDRTDIIELQADVLEIDELGRLETIEVEQDAVEVLTEAVQGPPGPQGLSGSGPSEISLEAGEDLVKGSPVYPLVNKLYLASNLQHNGVAAIVKEDVAAGFLAQAVTSGEVALDGLVAGAKYYLGDGEITNMPPSAGHLQEIGRALTSQRLLIDIKQDFLLN